MSQEAKEDKQEESKKEKKGWEDRILSFLKWLAIIGVFLFIVLTVLSRLGGNSDVLKESIEGFITDATPYTAKITTLNNMNFFPDIIIDVSGIELREGESEDTNTAPAIYIGAAKFALPFFDAMFRPGHFKTVELQGLESRPGVLHTQIVSIKSLNVQHDETGAFLAANGLLGAQRMDGKLELNVKGKPGRPLYELADERSFEINLADLKLKGTMKASTFGVLKLENLALYNGETQAVRANLDIDRQENGFGIKGQIRLQPGETQIDPDIKITQGDGVQNISGKISSGFLMTEDFTKTAPFSKALDDVLNIVGSSEGGLGLENRKIDLNINIDKIKTGTLELGSLQTPITLNENILNIGPLGGKIINGALGGDIKLDASGESATLNPKIMIKGFDYAELQKRLGSEAQIEGTADIIIDLQSKGESWNTLTSGLSGKAGFIGAQAKLRSGLLNVWGGGLLNAILPKLSEDDELQVNCVVANFEVSGLKAQSDAIFIDTEQVTLQGEGTYDLKADQLELVLDPKPKDVSIGDVSSAVNVSGPLSDLSVTPNVYDLGKKLGGLVLGSLNPAFFALTLADLGLRDDHPCKAYVIEKEVLPPPTDQ